MLTRRAVAVAALAAVGVVASLAAARPTASAQEQVGLSSAVPPHYTVTELPGLPGGPPGWGFNFGPNAINDRGQVAGSALVPYHRPHSYTSHAVLWDAQGHIHDIGPAVGASNARRISNTGQVLGEAWGVPLGDNHLFLYRDGRSQPVRSLPGVSAFLSASRVWRLVSEDADINNDGRIVLNVEQEAGASPAYVYDAGRFQALGLLPDGHGSEAKAINSLGQVVGTADTGGEEHAFLWNSGGMTDIGVLSGFDTSAASAVNTAGQVIGILTHSRDVRQDFGWQGWPRSHGFLWHAGQMQDLGTLPHDDYTQPTGINDKGQIVGNCYRFSVLDVKGRLKSIGCSLTGSSFLWQNGRMYDLRQLVPANWQLMDVRGINSQGQIIGLAYKNAGARFGVQGVRAVLLTPQ